MSGQRVERKLSAVLAADVARYSRLLGIDEQGTLAQVRSVRLTLIDPVVATHRGRISKATGDDMRAEFARCRRRRALRAGRAAWPHAAQCRDHCRPPHRVPDWDSPRRIHEAGAEESLAVGLRQAGLRTPIEHEGHGLP